VGCSSALRELFELVRKIVGLDDKEECDPDEGDNEKETEEEPKDGLDLCIGVSVGKASSGTVVVVVEVMDVVNGGDGGTGTVTEFEVDTPSQRGGDGGEADKVREGEEIEVAEPKTVDS
jgi:hypothetical protein